MSELALLLEAHSRRLGQPLERLVRRHVLEGLLRRLAHSPWSGSFLLRGGLLARAWLGERRTTEDADFLGLFARDLETCLSHWRDVLTTSIPEDGADFEVASLTGQGIWEETPFPGVRLRVRSRCLSQEHDLQIDVGFDDPVEPPPVWLEIPLLLPGAEARLLTCRPETLVGWKLHGLFEHGVRRWRAKDLLDLWLLTTFLTLSQADLTRAIAVAFTSRGDALEQIPALLYDPSWGMQEKNRQRWERLCTSTFSSPVPQSLSIVVEAVGQALRPALSALLPLPASS